MVITMMLSKTMSFVESLYVSAFGMSVVFLVLIGLMYVVKIQSAIYNVVTKLNNKKPLESTVKSEEAVLTNDAYSDVGLNLINVDDKTAAIIMAIVSDETKIPPNELNFKSIKLIDNDLTDKK